MKDFRSFQVLFDAMNSCSTPAWRSSDLLGVAAPKPEFRPISTKLIRYLFVSVFILPCHIFHVDTIFLSAVSKQLRVSAALKLVDWMITVSHPLATRDPKRLVKALVNFVIEIYFYLTTIRVIQEYWAFVSSNLWKALGEFIKVITI